jgi:hypothetical protein
VSELAPGTWHLDRDYRDLDWDVWWGRGVVDPWNLGEGERRRCRVGFRLGLALDLPAWLRAEGLVVWVAWVAWVVWVVWWSG